MKLRFYLTMMDLFAIAERGAERAFLWAVAGAGRNSSVWRSWS